MMILFSERNSVSLQGLHRRTEHECRVKKRINHIKTIEDFYIVGTTSYSEAPGPDSQCEVALYKIQWTQYSYILHIIYIKLIHHTGRAHHYDHYDLERSHLGPQRCIYNPVFMITLTFHGLVSDSIKHACTILPERGLTGAVFNQNKHVAMEE